MKLYLLFQDMFVPFMVDSAVELTLGANQNLADANRLQWKTNDHTTDGSNYFGFKHMIYFLKLSPVTRSTYFQLEKYKDANGSKDED